MIFPGIKKREGSRRSVGLPQAFAALTARRNKNKHAQTLSDHAQLGVGWTLLSFYQRDEPRWRAYIYLLKLLRRSSHDQGYCRQPSGWARGSGGRFAIRWRRRLKPMCTASLFPMNRSSPHSDGRIPRSLSNPNVSNRTKSTCRRQPVRAGRKRVGVSAETTIISASISAPRR